MKKLLLMLIAVFIVAVIVTPNMAVAEEVGSPVQNSEIYDFVEQLCEVKRTGTKDDVRAFLLDKFIEATDGKGSVKDQEFSVGQEKYVNLIATLTKSQASNQIIIGAHYDSVGEGAGDNACGVAALYMTMKAFAKRMGELPYSVVFVAFDAEELGLLGSQYYVGRLSQQTIKNTKLMVNFDTLATGDNLYLMCENKPTDLAKLILSKAQGVKEKPYAKGVFHNVSFDMYGYGYYEVVQGSDHTPFRLAGIPTALFFSGTYASTFWNYAENSDPSKAVMNTLSDTFDNLVAKHSDFEQRISTVSQAVVDTILSDEILTMNPRKQLVNLKLWYNVLWPYIAVVVIAVAALVFAIFYYRKLQKNAILGDSEIKSQTVFEKPNADDIFSFKTDDTDDIFTFKK